jgi:hypothetical protein
MSDERKPKYTVGDVVVLRHDALSADAPAMTVAYVLLAADSPEVVYSVRHFDRYGQLQAELLREEVLAPHPMRDGGPTAALTAIREWAVSAQDFELAAKARDVAALATKRMTKAG